MDANEAAESSGPGREAVHSVFDVDVLPEHSSDGWVFEPLPPPLRIEDFRLHFFTSPETAESSVQMSWLQPNIGGVVKIYRRILPLVTQAMPSGFQALVLPSEDDSAHFGWTVIAVKENEFSSGWYIDEDIPAINENLPKAARRPLGFVNQYRIEISGGARDARSPVRSTRIRGINSPRIESIAGISDSEIHVRWRDNSKLASGFQVHYFQKANGDGEGTITMNGTTRRDLIVQGLAADTEYLVSVRAWDYYGRSSVDSGEAQTRPAPEVEPEDKTFDLSLARQDVIQGNIPYLGRFPTAGNLPSGTLRRVSLNSVWPALLFVKPGRSTSECGDPNAVVALTPGSSLTAAEMVELYGSETPDLPIVFLACAQATSTLYNFIPIRITYRTD